MCGENNEISLTPKYWLAADVGASFSSKDKNIWLVAIAEVWINPSDILMKLAQRAGEVAGPSQFNASLISKGKMHESFQKRKEKSFYKE